MFRKIGLKFKAGENVMDFFCGNFEETIVPEEVVLVIASFVIFQMGRMRSRIGRGNICFAKASDSANGPNRLPA